MKPFVIINHNKLYQVTLNEHRGFTIRLNDKLMGYISPEAGNYALEWQSEDITDQNLVCELGELIEAHQLGNIPL